MGLFNLFKPKKGSKKSKRKAPAKKAGAKRTSSTSRKTISRNSKSPFPLALSHPPKYKTPMTSWQTAKELTSSKSSGKATIVKSKKKTIENKSKRYPDGRTLKTQDKYLQIKKNKSKELKKERWVAVVDSNASDEIAVVRLTTKKQPNTTELPTYKKGNKKATFFKHFLEIDDASGDPIKVDGVKFKENPMEYDLNDCEIKQVKDKLLKHTKQAQTNKEALETLKNRNKKR